MLVLTSAVGGSFKYPKCAMWLETEVRMWMGSWDLEVDDFFSPFAEIERISGDELAWRICFRTSDDGKRLISDPTRICASFLTSLRQVETSFSN